jgi:hypothetical protein
MLMILGGLGIAFSVWRASRVALFRRAQRETVCPYTHKRVRCTLVQDTLTRQWIDVERCSAAIPEHWVSCNKACLPGFNRG